MTLSAGAQLGPYEILDTLGAGGMGEVYRARDQRLDRTVAIKVLPQHALDSPTRRQRFEREARAASRLSHPHICALYDIGEQDSIHFIVMEYLKGETLADCLRRGALPIPQVLRYAIEIADALDHAHRQGIGHRDLKPANIMLTRSGAKLLDFGLARVQPAGLVSDSDDALPTRTESLTGQGTILGTLHYMAPEQLEAKDTDARTDIFAFGAVVYEMATGQPAFGGASKASLIAAILEHDPEPLSAGRARSESAGGRAAGLTPPLLDHVVSRCLAKDPDERWQSAADLRQALKWIGDTGSAIGVAASSDAGRGNRRERFAWLVAAVGVAIAAVSLLVARPNWNRAPLLEPAFKQLTFRRGNITRARFAPDGQTILYSSAWDGGPIQIFETRPQGPESRPLGPQSAGLESISTSGELALLLGCKLDWGWCTGTLARMPPSGGAPRELLEDVVSADWAPDGRSLAAIHAAEGEYRVEYPIGTQLYATAGKLGWLDFSPQGDRLAFIEYPVLDEESGALKVVDLAGRVTTVSTGWKTIRGLHWSPNGDAIWFTGSRDGKTCSVYAASLSGEVRLIFRAPTDMTLNDVSREGRMLLMLGLPRARMIWSTAGRERDLSWLDWSTVADLSIDGRTVLFHEWGEGVGGNPVVYTRRVDGSDAVRLGDGKALALSPDGRWALALVEKTSPQLVLLPTGTGQSRTLPTEDLTDIYWAKWFPDAKRLLLVAAGRDSVPRSYIQDVDTGRLESVVEPGTLAVLVSPDGRRILARDALGGYELWPLDGGEPVPVEGFHPDDRPFQWSADNRFLYLRGGEDTMLRVYRYDLATRRRDLWHELKPSDPTGVIGIATGRGELAITPDGTSYAFTYWVGIADLFLFDGVRE